jgi:lipid-A-disaccharide synthase
LGGAVPVFRPRSLAAGDVDRGRGECRLQVVRIVVSAGEASGRVMAEQFRLAMARLDPACEVVSLAETAELGPVFGFAEGLRSGGRTHAVLSRAEEAVVRLVPHIVVLISFSGLHLPLGRRLRRRGVPVLYLGPPQVWAWGGWRKRRLRKTADKVVCLFRFEEKLLRRAGVNAVYLGYPLLDGVVSRLSREQTLEKLGLGPSERYIVFLPGSRPAEIAYHQPLFIDVLSRLRRECGNIRGVMVMVEEGRSQKSEVAESGMVVVRENRYDVMHHADCACAVSGTVTTELALLSVPMVVCYHLPWLSRVLARALVRTPYFALPNILAGMGLVPEMLEPEPQALTRTLIPLTLDSDERRGQLVGLARVAAELGPPGATVRVCVLARELAAAGRQVSR